ncbi:hypothetical protein F6Y05_33730 (plasmid) [Bacillus megaterium]|nr:hypothetical protein [Priestia megaterium]
MGNKSTISSSKPLKQSSVRQKKNNPVKEAKQEEKPQVYIPIPMSKENNKQENEKLKCQTIYQYLNLITDKALQEKKDV